MHQRIKCRRLTISIWISLGSVLKSSNRNQFLSKGTEGAPQVNKSMWNIQPRRVRLNESCPGSVWTDVSDLESGDRFKHKVQKIKKGISREFLFLWQTSLRPKRHLWRASLSRNSFQHGRRSNILLHRLALYAFLMVKKCQWTVCLLFQSGWKMSEMSQ